MDLTKLLDQCDEKQLAKLRTRKEDDLHSLTAIKQDYTQRIIDEPQYAERGAVCILACEVLLNNIEDERRQVVHEIASRLHGGNFI